MISKVKNYAFPVLLGLVILNAVLNGLGIVPDRYLWYFIWLAVTVEATFFVVLIFKITRVVRCYRQLKKDGHETIFSLRQALEIALPPLVARWAVFEFQLYYILFKSFRNKGIGGKDGIYPNKLDNYRFFFKVLMFLCILEIIAVMVLVPSKWFKWKVVHFVIGVWAILLFTADYNAMKLYSNQVLSEGVRLQMGLRCCQDIAWDQMEAVGKESKSGATFSFGPEVPEDEPGVLYMTAGETSNISIDFKAPLDFQGMIKDFLKIRKVYLSLREPDTFIEMVKAKVNRTEGSK